MLKKTNLAADSGSKKPRLTRGTCPDGTRSKREKKDEMKWRTETETEREAAEGEMVTKQQPQNHPFNMKGNSDYEALAA